MFNHVYAWKHIYADDFFRNKGIYVSYNDLVNIWNQSPVRNKTIQIEDYIMVAIRYFRLKQLEGTVITIRDRLLEKRYKWFKWGKLDDNFIKIHMKEYYHFES